MSITTATLNGAATSVSDAAIDAFRGSIRGELVLSDSPSYETARRVWNGNIDRRPALIVRCTGPADVQRAVDFARTHELLLSRSRRRAQRARVTARMTAAWSSTCRR